MIKPLEPENNNSKRFLDIISEHFFYKAECNGIHSVTKKKKRIDFLIYPKKHLIEQNFPRIPIGVEIKPKIFEDGYKKQVIELYKQAIDYRYTKFKLKDKNEFLPLILIYPSSLELISNSCSQDKNFQEGFSYIATRLTGKMFIGDLLLQGDVGCEDIFKIILCGNTYYVFSKNHKGRKNNSNWGFELYEKCKRELDELNLKPDEYQKELSKILNLIGI